MGADQIFSEHPGDRPRRKRRTHLLDELSPETRRRLAECIDKFSPALRSKFAEVARELGIPIEAVAFYGGALLVLTRGRERTVKAIREAGLFPDADDGDLRAAIAECRRDLEREMHAIRGKRQQASDGVTWEA